MGYKAAVQVLRQAEDLKLKISRKCDLLNDKEIWTDQQKLQTIYHQCLVLDLEYALDKKVELDLWNIVFKNIISSLQESARDKKNARRSEYQVLLTWCLETASGFYLTLLQEICNTFDIDLPFRRRGNVFGQINSSSDQINMPQTSSCTYICQYCLVHLGDIARYRNQRRQAENFYKQAILVSPTSGHPYNQLALLGASQNDKLSTVFYYIRGISVKNPFPASTTNLLNTLSSAIDKESHTEKVPVKMTADEFIQLFLCTHGCLHTATDLKQAETYIKSLNSIMTALVATQSFTKDKLIKLTVINLFAYKHVTESNSTKSEDLTEDEKFVRELVLELLAGSLSAFLIPVHTLKMDETLLDYYALPAVKFLLYFIQNEPDVLKERVFTNRLQIWPSLCKLLNNVQKFLKDFDYSLFSQTPLPEDKTLQGFLHLSKNFKGLNFKQDLDSIESEQRIRIKRILDLSAWLAEYEVNGNRLINRISSEDDFIFEPGCIQPDPTNDLLEEMKSFSISEPSDTIKNKSVGPEKKTGILKPQGSLEKSREEREHLSNDSGTGTLVLSTTISSNKIESSKMKRTKQNVALQSIIKKIEESKQVKFSVEEDEKEKSLKYDKHVQKPIQPMQNQQFNLPLRTQSFNQNHPAFPKTQNSQSDFLNNLRNIPNIPLEKDNMYPTYKPDMAPGSSVGPQLMPQYHSLHSQNVFNTTLKNTKPPAGYNPTNIPPNNVQPPHTAFNTPQMSVPYPNMNYPTTSQSFNAWKREEIPTQPPPSSWWQNPNQSTPPQSFPRQDNFQMNYPFSQTYAPPNPMMPKPDFSAPPSNQGNIDMFNSPWSNFSRNNYDNGQNMSMRQAMLKEANNLGGNPSGTLGRLPNAPDKFMQNPPTSPGYSLFNTNSWTPNLVGQLRNVKPHGENPLSHLPQHSLFGGHGPQSLAQLLEQQNQMQKND